MVGVTLVVDVLVDNRGVEDGATSDGREVVVTVDSADGVVADVLAFLVEVDGATSDDFVGGVTFVARVTVVGVALVVDVLVDNRGVEDDATADVREVVVTVVSFDDVACLVVVAFCVVVDGATSDNFVVVVTFVAWVCVVGVGLSVGDVVDVREVVEVVVGADVVAFAVVVERGVVTSGLVVTSDVGCGSGSSVASGCCALNSSRLFWAACKTLQAASAAASASSMPSPLFCAALAASSAATY